MRRLRVTWIKTKRESVVSGRVGTLEPGKLGLGCKANQCSDAWIEGLGLLTPHETSLMEVTTLQLVMPAQPATSTSEWSGWPNVIHALVPTRT